MLSRSELQYLRKNGPLWQGLTKRNHSERDIEDALRCGFIALNPVGEGYVITQKGIDYLEESRIRNKCPKCGHYIQNKVTPHD